MQSFAIFHSFLILRPTPSACKASPSLALLLASPSSLLTSPSSLLHAALARSYPTSLQQLPSTSGVTQLPRGVAQPAKGVVQSTVAYVLAPTRRRQQTLLCHESHLPTFFVVACDWCRLTQRLVGGMLGVAFVASSGAAIRILELRPWLRHGIAWICRGVAQGFTELA
ncbi:unnamed protein product [Ilex paraguariensis]|uniref:Uncharacterized protein n=1 Tax=Ilex paraguariensis TaxID=185542 RepID=A0ABC8RNW7_9AQUA